MALAIILGTALYCFAYNSLAGRPESPWEGALWAFVNVVPWWFAFEASKRSATRWGKAFIVGAALIASLSLNIVSYAEQDIAFELLRRLPALGIVALLAGIGEVFANSKRPKRPLGSAADIVVEDHIAWITAAGNYVELHGCGKTSIERASLASVETMLATRGFVRIHRSTLVRKSSIARVRDNDVVLGDGTSLKLGKMYRAQLASQRPVTSVPQRTVN